MRPSSILRTILSLHCGSLLSSAPGQRRDGRQFRITRKENRSPGQLTAWPSNSIWTSPRGCRKPSRRPGTIGTGSCLLFILVKSEICESKKVAQAPFPTRGVPNVTPRTVVPTGRLSFMNNVSSSASAPPRE
jgi:hypothetical protein